MKKPRIIFLSLALVACSMQAANDIKPQNTLIYWDVNKVVINPDNTATAARNYPHLSKVFYNPELSWYDNYYATSSFMGMLGRITARKLPLGFFTKAKEGFVEKLIALSERSQPHHRYLREFAYLLGVSQKVTPGTADIIKRAGKAKIRQAYLTNIGDRVLREMLSEDRKRAKEHRQFELFDLLDPRFSRVATHTDFQEGKAKPHPDFYKGALDKLDTMDSEKQYEHLFFIDDSKPNVDAFNALQRDGRQFHGIQFHSPEQLEKELTALGLSLPQLDEIPAITEQ